MNKGLSPYISKAACHITAVACVCAQPRHAGHSHCPTCLESVVGATAVRNASDIKSSQLETVSNRGQPGDIEIVWYLRDGSKVSHNWKMPCCMCVCGEKEGGGGGGGGVEFDGGDYKILHRRAENLVTQNKCKENKKFLNR